jgi:alkanesulfonate monooxygenase SsuD/methylene tetrahydromethanopterin reductase-like flavin-dependent oxidoreductase (luciferase family)
MRLGVVLWPAEPWPEAEKQWRYIERLGFSHGWVYDHLAFRGARPWYDAYTTLAAAATVTSHIGLGTLVTSPNFRHPVPTVHAATTIAAISRGRFVLGLGSGSPDPTTDAGALGTVPASWSERLDRFTEWVELADLLLRQPTTTYTGRYYSAGRPEAGADTGRQEPRMPFALAAAGPRAMRLVARYAQTWVTLGDPGDRDKPVETAVAEQTARMVAACAQVGRNPATVNRLLLTGLLADRPLASVEAFRDLAGRAATAGVTDLVLHWPRESGRFAGDLRVLEEIAGETNGG